MKVIAGMAPNSPLEKCNGHIFDECEKKTEPARMTEGRHVAVPYV